MRTVAPFWSYEALLELFEQRPGEDVAETDLLRHFFPDEPLFDGGISLELFEKHFLLYRRLWLFDDELRQRHKGRLWIRGIRSTLVTTPLECCAWLDNETGSVCTEPSPCPIHRAEVPEHTTMKGYYLDWSNLEVMTGPKLTAMVDQFFRWMGGVSFDVDAVNAALKVFDLDGSATPDEIRTRWRELSKKNHPDRGGSLVDFQTISAAWDLLRKAYFLAPNLSPTVL